jgi:hypothetical protein
VRSVRKRLACNVKKKKPKERHAKRKIESSARKRPPREMLERKRRPRPSANKKKLTSSLLMPRS